MKEYILAHDIGTGSDKAVLVDFSGKIIAAATAPTPLSIRSRHGWSRIRRIIGKRYAEPAGRL